MKVSLGGIIDISTIDYPGEVASVLFFCGCPFRCPFCHNFELLDMHKGSYLEVEEVARRVLENRPLITGACLTGGEPMLQADQVVEISKHLKKEGLKVKLDTNGFFPERVEKILPFLDYVAVDIKAPLDPMKYARAIGIPNGNPSEKVKETIKILSESNIKLEARTTVIPRLVYSREDITSIARFLEEYGVDNFVLQQFRPDGGTLDEEYQSCAAPPRDYLLKIATEIKEIIPNVSIRTMENGEERV